MSAVWSLDLPDSQKIVLLALADCANDEGLCWPSMATLCKKCSKGERTVQGVIKQLVEAGHLTRREVPGRGCKYHVHPRSVRTPAKSAPPQGTTVTPAAAADKPSRTINNGLSDDNPKRDACQDVADCWNGMAKAAGLSACAKMTGKRRKSCQARLKADGFDAIRMAIEHVPKSRFLRGDSGSWGGASIDFILKPDTVTSILEGKYDDRTTAKPARDGFDNSPVNPYARAVIARQAERAGDVGRQPDCWP